MLRFVALFVVTTILTVPVAAQDEAANAEKMYRFLQEFREQHNLPPLDVETTAKLLNVPVPLAPEVNPDVTILAALSPQPDKPVSPLELTIDPEDQYPNFYGYCTWACLNTLGRRHDIPQLRTIVRDRWEKSNHNTSNPGHWPTVLQELNTRKVRYHYTKETGVTGLDPNKDNSILTTYAATHGAVVTFNSNNPYYGGSHSVLVTSYTPDTVKWYDPNLRTRHPDDPAAKTTLTAGRQWFDTYWSGFSVVVFPDKEQSNELVSSPTD